MTGDLARGPGDPAPPPVRLVHLGLGAFFRAHAAWYTHRAPDGAEWGIAAFAGRGLGLSEVLTAQDGLYTLVTRGPEEDGFEVVGSVVAAHAAGDGDAWRGFLASPEVRAVTLTVTEAGYCIAPDGGVDHEAVRDDVAALRGDLTAPVTTVPARLVAGLTARARSGADPLALVPCDNLPANGAAVGRVVRETAHLVSSALAADLDATFTTVSTSVDRITPRTAADDLDVVAAATGRRDRAPVVTEPFHDWVLAGEVPGGGPDWAAVGATRADDIGPYERRKLWLLNGAHSLLAYLGLARGHAVMAAGFADPVVRQWVEAWWDEARPDLGLPAAEVDAYLVHLRDRFSNRRIEHRLAQVAMDGSQKLPARVLPVLRAARAEGRDAPAATVAVAAWIAHLRAPGAPIVDAIDDVAVPAAAGPTTDAARRVLALLDPDLADDAALVDEIATTVGRIEVAGEP